MTLKIGQRYVDEKWQISFDWAAALDGKAVVSATVVSGVGEQTISGVTQEGTVTKFFVTGGNARPGGLIKMTATLDGGEIIGFNLQTPIRSR